MFCAGILVELMWQIKKRLLDISDISMEKRSSRAAWDASGRAINSFRVKAAGRRTGRRKRCGKSAGINAARYIAGSANENIGDSDGNHTAGQSAAGRRGAWHFLRKWLVELVFWIAAAATVSMFLYYCSYGKLTLHAAIGFAAGIAFWKWMKKTERYKKR